MKKIIDYHKYCPKCKHYKTDETEEPCNSCLTYPVNEDSRKPEYFEEEKKDVKG